MSVHVHLHNTIAVLILTIVCLSISTVNSQPGNGPCPDQELFTCASDGSYEPLQCVGMQCACVDTQTGERRRPVPYERRLTADCSDPVCVEQFLFTCAPDGSYHPVQCMGMGMPCVCVDILTGERLRPLPYEMRLTVNCTERCDQLACGPQICSRGYQWDSIGCPTCTCEPVPPPVNCTSITELLDVVRCHCDCIEITEIVGRDFFGNTKNSCPTCDQACNNMSSLLTGTCVTSNSTCPTGNELRIVGRYGEPQCVQRLANDEVCTVRKSSQDSGSMSGQNAQTKKGGIGQKKPDCQEGSICVQTGYKDYRCKTDNTLCTLARATIPHIECDTDGHFVPLHCDPILPANTSLFCRCVNVVNGTDISGTEVRVEPGMAKPNCQPRGCSVPGIRNSSRMFKVKHGGTYFDAANCRSCQCNDGDAEAFCSNPQSICTSIMSQNNCTLEGGLVIPHGEQITIECERCGCRNGQHNCVTIRNCNKTTNGSTNHVSVCQECEMLPPSPVCGPDGRNHKTECAAINCAGAPATEILDGPCQSNDVCALHPCPFTCVPGGAVACVGSCQPNQLRTCVDIDNLQCTGNDVESEVCGSDGVTYSSTCSLLQSTVDVQIAHSGACESEECTSIGEVCGSDGVTYPNPCVLRSKAVTRLDYPGACVTIGSTANEICENVQEQGLCTVTTDNCISHHLPENGCCPVCGGAVTIALDRNALTVAGSIDSDFLSFGYLASSILELFTEVPCTVLIDITSTTDIEISLVPENPSQIQWCVTLTEEIARTVNGENGRRRRRQTAEELPQVFDYTVAATTAQLVTRQLIITTDAGAMHVQVTLGALSLLVLSMLSVLLG